jgi:hypothetical protein
VFSVILSPIQRNKRDGRFKYMHLERVVHHPMEFFFFFFTPLKSLLLVEIFLIIQVFQVWRKYAETLLLIMSKQLIQFCSYH